MAVKRKPKRKPPFIARLKGALLEDLEKAGIPAGIEVEQIRGTKLHRITVIAAKFARMRYSERQDLTWRIVDQAIRKEEQLFISSIVTLTPSEATGEAAA